MRRCQNDKIRGAKRIYDNGTVPGPEEWGDENEGEDEVPDEGLDEDSD